MRTNIEAPAKFDPQGFLLFDNLPDQRPNEPQTELIPRFEKPKSLCNDWISLTLIKLGIDRPEALIDRTFVENHTLVRKTPN